ncbi:MAG: transcription antitermination factor NusB [Lachnospiraceae bacterium]|nr:transcription antitermination factor NusB [Lachnospiraceae bacterium]
MTRRQLRENIFKILFKLEFNSVDEMPEQLQFSLDNIGDNDDEDVIVKPMTDISEEDTKQNAISDKDAAYITDKTNKIIGLISEIDAIIKEVSSGWQLDRIGKAELAILRLAIYEMKYDEDVPFKVAINEAVELSKIYCNEDAKGFVNGVLAKVEE